ncbi:hypothetical protein LDG_5785 [Legionella drancourtii LLAP12]|uniref:Uncharacterized protein n=1 Tax=Legionella drancourtii LLAP12 TaxID=658187 RepID=G9EKP7_9GAMM|nr:hypothetical protein LDG_5785 [Legionella drancourtii LLAP12]
MYLHCGIFEDQYIKLKIGSSLKIKKSQAAEATIAGIELHRMLKQFYELSV